jgi:hypothetical protein
MNHILNRKKMKKLFGLLKPSGAGAPSKTKEDLTLSDGEEQKHQMPPNSFPTPMMNPADHHITGENEGQTESQVSTKEKESTSAEGEQ